MSKWLASRAVVRCDGGPVLSENPVQLFFNPGDVTEHYIHTDAGLGIDPLVPRLPELVADFRTSGARRDLPADVQRNRLAMVHIQIDIGTCVGTIRGARTTQRTRLDLGQLPEALCYSLDQYASTG